MVCGRVQLQRFTCAGPKLLVARSKLEEGGGIDLRRSEHAVKEPRDPRSSNHDPFDSRRAAARIARCCLPPSSPGALSDASRGTCMLEAKCSSMVGGTCARGRQPVGTSRRPFLSWHGRGCETPQRWRARSTTPRPRTSQRRTLCAWGDHGRRECRGRYLHPGGDSVHCHAQHQRVSAPRQRNSLLQSGGRLPRDVNIPRLLLVPAVFRIARGALPRGREARSSLFLRHGSQVIPPTSRSCATSGSGTGDSGGWRDRWARLAIDDHHEEP